MKIKVCHGCTEREIGCHANCERYKNARAEYDAELTVIYKNKAEYYRQIDQEVKRKRRRK